jgi:hypothetical protein
MTKEKFFVSLLSNLNITKDTIMPGNVIFKDYKGFVWFYFINKKRTLLVNEDCLWQMLEHKYDLKYSDVKNFIFNQLNKHIGLKPESILYFSVFNNDRLIHLKWKRTWLFIHTFYKVQGLIWRLRNNLIKLLTK